MHFCSSCGMPLDSGDLLKLKKDGHCFCIYCVDENNEVKSCEEIFEDGVKFFMESIPNITRDIAEKVTRKNMTSLVYWKEDSSSCLSGDVVTDEDRYISVHKIAFIHSSFAYL